jgi:hypothetical protein
MNQPLFLHIVERLEGFLGKLPDSIQKPVLNELTPMKELFLKQRPPRFVLTGSHKLSIQEVVATLFAAAQPGDLRDVLMEVYRWHETDVGGHGNIRLLDARGADEAALKKIEQELQREGADIFLHLVDGNSARPCALARDGRARHAYRGEPSRRRARESHRRFDAGAGSQSDHVRECGAPERGHEVADGFFGESGHSRTCPAGFGGTARCDGSHDDRRFACGDAVYGTARTRDA